MSRNNKTTVDRAVSPEQPQRNRSVSQKQNVEQNNSNSKYKVNTSDNNMSSQISQGMDKS